MRSLTLSASVLVSTLALVAYDASAQTGYAPSATAPATMQAPTTAQPPAAIRSARRITADAPGSRIDSEGSGAIPALPLDVQSSNGITYLNGGIGDEEIAELKSKEKDFNVHVLLTAPGGDFISDATVTVWDGKGNSLLTVNDAGPYFYARLQPGTYTLEAAAAGEVKKAKIKVTAHGDIKKEFNFNEAGGITTVHKPTATID